MTVVRIRPTAPAKFTDYAHAADPRAAWWRVQYPLAPGDTGTPQYDRFQIVDDPSSVTDPRRPGGKVMRVEIRPYHATYSIDPVTGASVGNADGDIGDGHKSRAEVYDMYPASGASSKPWAQWPFAANGGEWFISYKLMLAPDWVLRAGSPAPYMILSQIGKGFRGGSPPLAFGIDNNVFKILRDGISGYALGASTRGVWHDFLFHVKFDPDPTVGFIEVWKDGVLAMPLWHGKTMEILSGAPDPVYWKQGIYRVSSWDVTHVAHFGDTRIGTTRESVAA